MELINKKGKTMKEKYAYSICGEIYYSKKDILDFLDKEDSKQVIYVGECIYKKHEDFIDADDIIEMAKDRAYEDNEYAEGYLDDITKEKEQELNKLIIDWLNNNAEQPTFFTVKNIKQITSEEFHKEHLK